MQVDRKHKQTREVVIGFGVLQRERTNTKRENGEEEDEEENRTLVGSAIGLCGAECV
jgi:hypothetical protein